MNTTTHAFKKKMGVSAIRSRVRCVLWMRALSKITRWFSSKRGHNSCSSQVLKRSALQLPSNSIGAVNASSIRAANKVVVRFL